MGDKLTLALDERTAQGKKVAKLRKDGIVPAVVYGPGIDPINVQAPKGVIEKIYRQAGTYTPVYLTIGSKKKIAMIKEVDRDVVKGTIRHVSFHAVRATDPVTAEVPIHLEGEGESEAEKAGLIILQTLDKIEVKALPMDLPDALHANIRGLVEAGEKLYLSDITLPEKVEYVEHETGHGDDSDEHHSVTELIVASVWEPSALQAANETSGGPEDESEVESEHGEDTPQDSQAEETKPGGHRQDEPKQSNVDANK